MVDGSTMLSVASKSALDCKAIIAEESGFLTEGEFQMARCRNYSAVKLSSYGIDLILNQWANDRGDFL